MHPFYDQGSLLPLKKSGKAPLRTDWRNVILPPDTLARYIAKGHNLGYAIPPCQLVLDVDPRNGGDASFDRLAEAIGTTPEAMLENTFSVATGGGGYHLYYTVPDPTVKTRESVPEWAGLEFKRHGKQVVIAGSTHPSGKLYRVYPRCAAEAATLPPFIWSLVQRVPVAPKVVKTQPAGPDMTPGELAVLLSQIPVDQFVDHALWFELLCACHAATAGAGLVEFLHWCSGDSKYATQAQQNIIETRWKSLTPGAGYTAGTLYHYATQHGARVPASVSSRSLVADYTDDDLVLPAASHKRKLKKTEIVDRAVAIVKERLDIINAADQQFWLFDGVRWVDQKQNIIEKEIVAALRSVEVETEKTINVSAFIGPALRLLAAETAVPIDMYGNRNSVDCTTVNTLTHEIDITRDGRVTVHHGHRREKYLINVLPVEYDPVAECPLFLKTLEGIFSGHDGMDEMIDHVFEWFGYSIQNYKNIPAFWLLHGYGANGKSTVLHVLQSLGQFVTVAGRIEEFDVSKNAHAMESLIGKNLLVDDDVGSNVILADAFLKQITEVKNLQINPKFKPRFQSTVAVSVSLACNNWPRLADITHGVTRRAFVIPFCNRFDTGHRNDDLKFQIVDHELPGVLNMALKGLIRMRKKGFTISRGMEMAKNRWLKMSNPLTDFLMLNYKVTGEGNGTTSLESIHEAYQQWCLDNSIPERYRHNRRTLSQQIEAWGAGKTRTSKGVSFYVSTL